MTTQLLTLNLETRALGTKQVPPTHGQLSPIHLTVDCTALPNPHKYFPTATGRTDAVQTWLQQSPTVTSFLKRTVDDIANLLTAEVERNGVWHPVNVAVTCPGGRHRSPAIATLISRHLLAESQLWVHPVVMKVYFTSLKESAHV